MQRSGRRRRRWPWILLAMVVALGLMAAWVMFLPPFHVAELTARPEFCGSCHNMEPELRAFEAGPHNVIDSCNDCHLPNDNALSHYAWDAYVGTRDLVSFYLRGKAPYDSQATPRSRVWIHDNCVRCHAEAVSKMPQDRECWSCHRIMYHRFQLTRVQGEDL